jgi:hypothetical protein
VPVAFSGQGLIFTTLPTKLPPDSYDYAPRVVTTDSSGSAGIFWWTGGIFGSYSVMATTPAGFDALSPATFTCVVPMPDTRPLISH